MKKIIALLLASVLMLGLLAGCNQGGSGNKGSGIGRAHV